MMIKTMSMLAAEGDRRRTDEEDKIAKEKKMFMDGMFSVSNTNITDVIHLPANRSMSRLASRP
jgi:hypothetical protein